VAAYASADAPGLLVGAESGGLARWAAADGAEVWKAELGAAASVLHSADIDGDGVPEVLAGTAASEIVVLDGDTGQERWRRSLKNLYDNPAPATTLRVADLEGEGQLDVLCGTAGWFVNVFEPDGTPTWAQWIRYHVITALEAADVDGDGRAEVIVGNTYSTSLTVHEFDGTFRWSTLEQVGAEGNATTPRRGIGLRQLRLADVDGDGVQEVLYGTDDGWLFAVDPRAGDEVWQLNIVGAVVGLEVLADSVLVAGEFGDLVVLGHDGRRRRHEVIHGWNRAAVRVGDTVVIAGEQGRLTRVNREGHVIEAWQLEGEIQRLVATPDLLVAVLNDQLVAVRVDG
jgi:outer membrane protein assembly factor BamB